MSFTLSLRESYDDSADCARYCDSTNVTLLFLCPAMHMFVFIRGKNDRQLSIQSKYSVTCYKHYILQNVHSYFGILRCGSWSVVLLSVAHKSIRTPRFSEYFNNYKRVRLGAVSTPPPPDYVWEPSACGTTSLRCRSSHYSIIGKSLLIKPKKIVENKIDSLCLVDNDRASENRKGKNLIQSNWPSSLSDTDRCSYMNHRC